MGKGKLIAAATAAVQAYLAEEGGAQSAQSEEVRVHISPAISGKSSMMVAVLAAVETYLNEDAKAAPPARRRRRAWREAVMISHRHAGYRRGASWRGRD